MNAKPEICIGWILAGLIAIGLGVLFLFSPSPMKDASASSDDIPYIDVVNPSGFVNTDGITLQELVGKKVILVDFMTYSCINCQRTFPYLNAWYEKYKDEGLEIVGIHTPEFAFEKDINNVREAMRKFGITFPVVLDNDYATWNAYGNRYWPRKYLIDIHGNVVYDHIGEGKYDETETKIKELLTERAAFLNEALGDAASETLAASSILDADVRTQSPETYFGSHRNEYLGNGVSGIPGEREFTLPEMPMRNTLYLGGRFNLSGEYAEVVRDARVVYRFLAKEVYIVADADSPVEVEVLIDGKPAGALRGADVSENGTVTIQESRLYKLVRLPGPEEHTLTLRVKGSGVRFYAFTFG